MKNILLALSLLPMLATGQNKVGQDKASIKQMCGCYEVTFEYAETFSPDTSYKVHAPHKSGGLEWVFVDEEKDDKVVLQHLLIINDSSIIKHWRQDWLYENTDLYSYVKGLEWKYTKLSKEQVKGQWTQRVAQVDDSPRYEGSATWIHADGKHYWENETDAPLPRREFTTRSDYNVLRRNNRHIITGYGWLHEQDNTKIARDDKGDKVIAMEKGLNKYKKLDDSKCKAAAEWWKNNQAYWTEVRAAWDELLAQKKQLKLEKKIDNKLLWERLFGLGDAVAAKEKTLEEAKKEIRSIIQQYVKKA